MSTNSQFANPILASAKINTNPEIQNRSLQLRVKQATTVTHIAIAEIAKVHSRIRTELVSSADVSKLGFGAGRIAGNLRRNS